MKESTILYSYARNNLKSVLTQAYDNHESILIKCKNGKNAVILSEEDYDSMAETMYLMRSKENYKKLKKAMKEKGGKVYKNVDEIKKEYSIK